MSLWGSFFGVLLTAILAVMITASLLYVISGMVVAFKDFVFTNHYEQFRDPAKQVHRDVGYLVWVVVLLSIFAYIGQHIGEFIVEVLI